MKRAKHRFCFFLRSLKDNKIVTTFCKTTVTVLGFMLYYYVIKSLIATLPEHDQKNYGNGLEQNLYFEQNGDYWVIHNFKRATYNFIGNESITLITWATIDELYMLKELLMRWQGPISISVFANDYDYHDSVEAINYLLQCSSFDSLVENFITFHFVAHFEHFPRNLTASKQRFKLDSSQNCAVEPSGLQKNRKKVSYWIKNDLKIPHNLLRNVARRHAETYFVMAMDPDLYPLSYEVNKYLRMLEGAKTAVPKPQRSLYCFAVVDLADKPTSLPYAKKEALSYLKKLAERTPKNTLDNRVLLRLYQNTIRFLDRNLTIGSIHFKSTHCTLANIFINSMRPMFDERVPYDNRELRVLEEMDYNFVVIRGTFIMSMPKKSLSADIIHKTKVKKSDMVPYPLFVTQWKKIFV